VIKEEAKMRCDPNGEYEFTALKGQEALLAVYRQLTELEHEWLKPDHRYDWMMYLGR
jgi:hypothetical protein